MKSTQKKAENIEIGKRLTYARKLRGFENAVDFARENGIEDQTYISHENGTRGIKTPVAIDYCDKLRINLEWLINGAGPMDKIPFPDGRADLAENFRRVVWAPVVSRVQAGKFAEARGGMAEDEHKEYLPCVYNRPTVLAFQAEGTSMNRVAPSGTYVFIDYEDRELIDRKIYLFLLGDEVTFKRYRMNDGRVWLEPDSTEPHDIIIPKDGMRVIGRMVGSYRKE